ncbi:MAG TPA: glycosyltransferase, partial [Terriglobales bacterium]|nr:glycosyltransferase [Terriglobales bacterium]
MARTGVRRSGSTRASRRDSALVSSSLVSSSAHDLQPLTDTLLSEEHGFIPAAHRGLLSEGHGFIRANHSSREAPTSLPQAALSSATQSALPRPPERPDKKTWRVIHACDSIRSVADLVEAQVTAGMRPFVLTGEARPRPASLLETWADVRSWRKQLDGTDGTTHTLQSSVVHGHSFAATMAAMRAGLITVYDVHAFVDDFAVTAGQCTERSWLARSFRTAEEFLLPRVGAVVVHSTLMKQACLQSGLEKEKENVFLIPEPMHLPSEPDSGWLRRAFDFSDDVVTIFARPAVAEDETLIRAFAQVAEEVPGVRLFIATATATATAAAAPHFDGQAAQLRRFAHQHDVAEKVFVLSPEDEDPALRAADIVIAGWPVFPDDSSWGRIHALTIARSGTALAAMAHGRCLLAADCSAHRDLTPEGRGVLWFGQSTFGSSSVARSADQGAERSGSLNASASQTKDKAS